MSVLLMRELREALCQLFTDRTFFLLQNKPIASKINDPDLLK